MGRDVYSPLLHQTKAIVDGLKSTDFDMANVIVFDTVKEAIDHLYRNFATAILGFPPYHFVSSDYYPLLPWIFLFLAGYWLGEAFLQRRAPEFCYREHLPALGWIGRHTQLVVPRAGSAFFIGELLLNLPADTYDSPITSGGTTDNSDSFATLCGTCTRCIDACPTHALSTGGLDARRCLSYLTIENRGPIPDEAARKMYPYLYGCDRCLQACPHLRHAVPTQEPAFTPRPELLQMTKEDWRHLSVEQYRRLFKGSAVKRAKYEGLVRNLTALGLTCPHPENPLSPNP